MSATHDKKESFVYNLKKKLHPLEVTILETNFDAEVDWYIQNLKVQEEEKKLIIKCSIIKVLTGPFEYALARITLGKENAAPVAFEIKMCFKVLTRKITFDQFKKNMLNYYKGEK